MRSITIYQCFPCYKPGPTSRIINQLDSTKYKILLDIEDSIQDIHSPKRAKILKEKARLDLAEILQNTGKRTFSLRLNAIHSEEYQLDKQLLYRFCEYFDTIFIPKVESVDDLSVFAEEFGKSFKINIIIETQKGIENLDQILSSEYAHSIQFVFFGNYDYHLDRNIYPITEQNNSAYWDIVRPIIKMVERHGFYFGNSGYVNIADVQTLEYSLHQLFTVCENDFALFSLHKKQSHFFNKLLSELPLPILQETTMISAIYDNIDDFQKNKLKGRSFALNNANRIITPHEYLLLLRKMSVPQISQ